MDALRSGQPLYNVQAVCYGFNMQAVAKSQILIESHRLLIAIRQCIVKIGSPSCRMGALPSIRQPTRVILPV